MKDKSVPFTIHAYKFLPSNQVHLACNSCRSSKAKCSGDRPKCERCARREEPCIYSTKAAVKARRKQTAARSSPSNDRKPSKREDTQSPGSREQKCDADDSKPRQCEQDASRLSGISISPMQIEDIQRDTMALVDHIGNNPLLSPESLEFDTGEFRPPSSSHNRTESTSMNSDWDASLADFPTCSFTGDTDLDLDLVNEDSLTALTSIPSTPSWSLSGAMQDSSTLEPSVFSTTPSPIFHRHRQSPRDDIRSDTQASPHQVSSFPSSYLNIPFSKRDPAPLIPEPNPQGCSTSSCTCANLLTSAILSLNSPTVWFLGSLSHSDPVAATAVPDLGAFLVAYQDAMDKCDAVINCASLCVLQNRELAVLLMVVVGHLARLVVDMSRMLPMVSATGHGQGVVSSHRPPGASSNIPPPPEEKPESSPTASTTIHTTDTLMHCRRQPAPLAPSPIVISVGAFAIEDESEREMIVRQLLGSRAERLKALIRTIRAILAQQQQQHQAGVLIDDDGWCASLDAMLGRFGEAMRLS